MAGTALALQPLLCRVRSPSRVAPDPKHHRLSLRARFKENSPQSPRPPRQSPCHGMHVVTWLPDQEQTQLSTHLLLRAIPWGIPRPPEPFGNSTQGCSCALNMTLKTPKRGACSPSFKRGNLADFPRSEARMDIPKTPCEPPQSSKARLVTHRGSLQDKHSLSSTFSVR